MTFSADEDANTWAFTYTSVFGRLFSLCTEAGKIDNLIFEILNLEKSYKRDTLQMYLNICLQNSLSRHCLQHRKIRWAACMVLTAGHLPSLFGS